MILRLFLVAVPVLFLGNCANLNKDDEPVSSASAQRVESSWWRQFNDAGINEDVAAAFANNPELRAVALRIDQADAAVDSANASLLPRVNVGLGHVMRRKREADFGPYTLAPWRSGAMLRWELDLSGKLKAAKRSAISNRSASVWDYHAARLDLASKIAAVRFNLYRFNAEIGSYRESISGSKRVLGYLNEQLSAGLISESDVNNQRVELARIERQKENVTRLRDLSVIQLHTLRGGTSPKKTLQTTFPTIASVEEKPLNKLLASHPSLLAAEARVRSAFQLERSSRLNLLPSFSIGAGVKGGQTSLRNRYKVWTAKVGPSLDIPIYDPARIAAVKLHRAKRRAAAANYQSAVLRVLAEVESAKVNLWSKSSQLWQLSKEISASASSLKLSQEKLRAGLISKVDFLETERRWLESTRKKAALTQAKLDASLNLLKALGGGM